MNSMCVFCLMDFHLVIVSGFNFFFRMLLASNKNRAKEKSQSKNVFHRRAHRLHTRNVWL